MDNAGPKGLPDTRDKNLYFNQESAKSYLDEYVQSLKSALDTLDPTQLDRAFKLMEETTLQGGTIYTGGNGGSAAICNHLCCDWTKGTEVPGRPHLKTISLVGNMPVFSAIGNDLGYEKTLSRQIEFLMTDKDCLLLVSSSGNSPNIVEACKAAQTKNIPVIGFSGFEGGELSKMADANLHLRFSNYGIVEDGHQVLMHVLAQFFYLRRQG